eukprot:CAMPEP_0201116072 /NCGR_PEP_ID=MMETSP0850-20130426/449_1 /ASSEMBLY_ACC=CAM_ASM_000622 /TAXON_ID=183588 /ORGANISM="Pseudo-nitzschia fraudulenta, Strain WWA7" /LENGTH=523 /DNA_ID=CAMNT_0047380057 /DNA_START=280 /DNA_END=1851 /DNA_ORIENTATION=+
MTHLVLIICSSVTFWNDTNAFVPISVNLQSSSRRSTTTGETVPSRSPLQSCLEQLNCRGRNVHPNQIRRRQQVLYGAFFEADNLEDFDDDYDDDDDEDDDDDQYIDTDSLGDWRNFRRSLAMGTGGDNEGSSGIKTTEESAASAAMSMVCNEREVTENEKILESQNKELADEFASGVWAYQTATPEVGGLVVRLPLEVELYRNYRHSIAGSKLRAMLVDDGEGKNTPTDELVMSHWYGRSRDLIESQMKEIADMADEEGQIDATTLAEDYSEMLTLYLDNQEQWQEVCLVLEQKTSSEGSRSAKTLVLNRPMAFKLTKDMGRLVYFGAFDQQTKIGRESAKALTRFMIAFRDECAVYVGGPDDQGESATIIHGIRDLPGAVEISPGTNIYRGGLDAAIDGVLNGKYNPLEFRFFVGCHNYEESMLDVEVRLGKYQPVACARALALKQCISLPQPLWHEVMELCNGDLPDISRLEMLKSDDLSFQVLDESASDFETIMDDDDDIDIDVEIIDDDDDDDDTTLGW